MRQPPAAPAGDEGEVRDLGEERGTGEVPEPLQVCLARAFSVDSGCLFRHGNPSAGAPPHAEPSKAR